MGKKPGRVPDYDPDKPGLTPFNRYFRRLMIRLLERMDHPSQKEIGAMLGRSRDTIGVMKSAPAGGVSLIVLNRFCDEAKLTDEERAELISLGLVDHICDPTQTWGAASAVYVNFALEKATPAEARKLHAEAQREFRRSNRDKPVARQ